jgi:hypothetical protein
MTLLLSKLRSELELCNYYWITNAVSQIATKELDVHFEILEPECEALKCSIRCARPTWPSNLTEFHGVLESEEDIERFVAPVLAKNSWDMVINRCADEVRFLGFPVVHETPLSLVMRFDPNRVVTVRLLLKMEHDVCERVQIATNGGICSTHLLVHSQIEEIVNAVVTEIKRLNYYRLNSLFAVFKDQFSVSAATDS